MQVILWVIFGGTLGLAALVGRHRSDPREIRLSQEQIPLATVWVRLPLRWAADGVSASQGKMQVLAVEPPRRSAQGIGLNGRELLISEQRVPDQTTLQFLNRGPANGPAEGRTPEAVYIAGRPGLMIVDQNLEPLGGQPVGWSIVAGTVLPSGAGIAIQLVGNGQITDADKKAVRALAAGISPMRAMER